MATEDDSDDEFYDELRGTCPRCASPAVRHLIIGMPTANDPPQGTPDWVEWVGCIHPGYDRRCPDCGFSWEVDGDLEVSR